jgi:ABC-type antimicrobial peptide transport system permease subunit
MASLCFALSALSSIVNARERVRATEEAKALIMEYNPNPAFEKQKNLPAESLYFDNSDLKFIKMLDPSAESLPLFINSSANVFRYYFLQSFRQINENNFQIYVVDPRYFTFFSIEAIQGRTFDRDDLRSTNLIVINNTLQTELFGEGNDQGFLNVAGIDYRIIGVVDDHNKGFNFKLTSRNYEPGAIYILPSASLVHDRFDKIIFKLSSMEVSEETIELIATEYRMLNPDKASRVVFQAFADDANIIIRVFTQGATVFLIFSLALFLSSEIGLFGLFFIFNKERIRNICVKIVCGASSKVVFAEVLLEFLVISLIGSMIGVLSAHLLVHAVNVVLSPPIEILCNFWIDAGLLLGINTLTIGLALYPAYRAAQSNPAEVLHEL